MRKAINTILAAPVLLASLTTARAAEPPTLTLAFQGTVTSDLENAKPEPVSMGIIVDFTNRTVQGFGAPVLDYPIGITAWNDVTVAFFGHVLGSSTVGIIDRVTGDVEATSMAMAAKAGNIIMSVHYALKCSSDALGRQI